MLILAYFHVLRELFENFIRVKLILLVWDYSRHDGSLRCYLA